MGIQGLLPLLKEKGCMSKRHLSHYKGKTAAIDTFVWLHRGAIPDCKDLAFGRCNPDKCRYVPYVFKYVDMLISYGIKPILVFDGANLPSKEATEIERREKRRAKKQEAMDLERRTPGSRDAFKLFQQTIDVTFDMVQAVIAKARKKGVDYIVAPHEADIQITYLVKKKYADFAISEDSDLIVMGCPTTVYKFKLDQNTVDEISVSKVYQSTEFKNEKMLKMAAVLQGCDYLPKGVPRQGLKTIATWFSKQQDDETQNLTLEELFDKNPKLQCHKQEFYDDCRVALLTLDHQIIFNPKRLKREHFKEVDEATIGKEVMVNFGSFHENVEKQKEFNLLFALGNVNYKTNKLAKQQFNIKKMPSLFGKNIVKSPEKKPKAPTDTGMITPLTKKIEKVTVQADIKSPTQNSTTKKLKKRTNRFFRTDSLESPLEPSQKKLKTDTSPTKVKLTASEVLDQISESTETPAPSQKPTVKVAKSSSSEDEETGISDLSQLDKLAKNVEKK